MTKQINVGGVPVGGGAKVSIQSMTTTDTGDIQATAAQINALHEAGCDIVRFAVNSTEDALAIRQLKQLTHVPLVADVQFDYRLAIASVENGIDKLRINPGNIGSAAKVAELVAAAKSNGVPIRIGANGGSLDKDTIARHGGRNAEALVESTLKHVALLERQGYYDIIIAAKHSDVQENVKAYRMLAEQVDYPLHLGVTEAGTERMALIKSAAGIGSLLLDGIGDTIRVSIAGDPLLEPAAGKDILRACGLLHEGVEIIACPTCARCGVDVEAVADEVQKRVAHIKAPVKAAVMGCVVNGPGEASMADVGIAGAKDKAILFRKGEKVESIDPSRAADILVDEIERMAKQIS